MKKLRSGKRKELLRAKLRQERKEAQNNRLLGIHIDTLLHMPTPIERLVAGLAPNITDEWNTEYSKGYTIVDSKLIIAKARRQGFTGLSLGDGEEDII